MLDATGEAGAAIVAALLASGRPVIAASSQAQALADLPAPPPGGPDLHRVQGNTHTETAGAALANAVRLLRRPLGAVVAVLGGELMPGRLLDHDRDFLSDALDGSVFPHLIAARHLLPLLSANPYASHYLVVGGPAADTPWAGYGHASVASAALRMFSRALREETLGTTVRVQQLSVCAPLRTRQRGDAACPDWPEPSELGLQVVELLASPGTEPVVRFDRRQSRSRPSPSPELHSENSP
ncbi:SDR family oxidoreductase [Arenimonas aestuarii]